MNSYAHNIPKYETETELELEDDNSPININTSEAIPVNMGVLQSDTLWSETSSIIENDGIRGVSLSLCRPGLILHGPLGENYRFKELHFHWGFADDDGTEHSLDDNFGTIEAHFVFIRAYTIHTDIEYLETAKQFDEKVAHRDPVVKLKKRNDAKSESAVRIQVMENKVEEIEEKMILDRWQKEKARKAVQNRRPTKFEFDTLPTYKEREQSIDIGYKDEEELRRQVMTQEDFTKFKDMLKMQQSARKCAERKAHLDSKERYVKWKAKEDAYDEKLKAQRDVEEDKLNQDELLLSQTAINDMVERKRRKMKTADLYRERLRKEASNKVFDDKLRIKRANELNQIQQKTIELVCNVAVLFEVNDDAPLYEAFQYFSLIQEPFTELSIDKNLLVEFKDSLLSPNYYAYHSHQSPSESQGLLWIIMRDPLPIRKTQVDNFRLIKSMYGEEMTSSRRAIRDIKRKVYMNWKPCIPKEFVCPGKEYCHCEGRPDPKRNYWEI